jgi:phenylpropionate dioxygenase-like ring-hydroxylating dioxygenase large terminal subunit
LRPHGPARTTVVCDLLFHPDEIASDRFDPSDAAELWDLVSRQDWAICESVQPGMSSRAWQGGWFAPMEDESADISRWYLPPWAMMMNGNDGCRPRRTEVKTRFGTAAAPAASPAAS